MRFLIDENLPPSAVGFFTMRGPNAVHVETLGRGARDRLIADEAAAAGRIVVTRDKDFADLPHLVRQVVLIRDRNASRRRLVRLWEARWPHIEAALRRGETLVVVDPRD